MFILASVTGVLALRAVHSVVSPAIPVNARELAFVLVMAGGLLIGHAWTFRLVDPRGWDFVWLGAGAWRPDRVLSSAVAGACPPQNTAAIPPSTRIAAAPASGSAQRRRRATPPRTFLRPAVVPIVSSPVSTSRFRSSRSRRRSLADW